MFIFQGYNELANGVLATVSYHPSSGGKVFTTFHLICSFIHVHIKLLLLGVHLICSWRQPQQQQVFNEVIFCIV